MLEWERKEWKLANIYFTVQLHFCHLIMCPDKVILVP